MRKSTNERGIALLTVITALVALMVIAVPFALQMRKGYERSQDENARKAVMMQVDSVMRFLEAYLVQTTERVEVANRRDERKVPNNDPEFDTMVEILPTRDQVALAIGEKPEALRNPYGTILGWDVEDENGKINLNSVSPDSWRSATCWALSVHDDRS